MVFGKRKMRTNGEIIFDVFNSIFMIFIIVITVLPFLTQVSLSVATGADLYKSGIFLFPEHPTLTAYKLIMKYDLLWISFRNSLVRVFIAVVLSIIFTFLVAYPLSKRKLPFNRAITAMILFTMLFQGGLIPSYLLVRSLGMLNTVWALVIPGMISAFNVVLMRNFIKCIPESIEESAIIDGANKYTILWKIVFPLSLPIVATVALWVAVGNWNEWFHAMIYISDPKKNVLQVLLRNIVILSNPTDINSIIYKMQKGGDDTLATVQNNLKAAVIVVAIIPMVIMYPFAQKYFIKGIMIGSVKG